MIKTTYFTICARNYLAYALTLRDSLRAVEPDATFIVFLADAPISGEAPQDVEIVPIEELNHPAVEAMTFRYSIMEFSTAIKAICFQHVLGTLKHERAVYLDPDVQIFAPLTDMMSAFDNGASVVLTPHRLTPVVNATYPSDIDILRSGVFNLGFAGLASTQETLKFLDWWASKLETDCFVDLEQGLFVDQRFVDLAPGFLEKLHVLRHPGYNVAYWNLSRRDIRKTADGWTINGQPLVFFHFSGVIPGNTTVFSKHQSRFDLSELGDVSSLVSSYLERLNGHDHARWSREPYEYDSFDTGDPVPDLMRRGPPAIPDNPFARPNLEYWSAPAEEIDQLPGQTITRFMIAAHNSRPDLRAAFPLSTQTGRVGFCAWFTAHGSTELRLNPALTAALTTNRSGQPSWRARFWLWMGKWLGLF